MSEKRLRISKSQYIKGLQCPKALWLYRHRPDLFPEIPESRQNIFDMGNEIGKYAQHYFSDGIEITEPYYEIDKAIQSTVQAIKSGHRVIFEATACSNDNAFSRIDILKKVEGADTWDLIEVKGTTRVKDYHLDDAALQRYAFTGAGYHIRKSYLMHVNRQYVRQGEIALKKLFELSDITEEVVDRMTHVPTHLNRLFAAVKRKSEPDIDIGGHCYDPFECDYVDYCWKHIPDYSVYRIFRGDKRDALLSQGIVDPLDVPDDFDMTDRERIEIQSYKEGTVYVDTEAVKRFLDTITYPLYFLDYETIAPAIPIYDGTRPYQQIPFQFSLHIQDEMHGQPEHIDYLHTEISDPRRDLIQRMVDACGGKGSVIVYNKSFESRINYDLGISFPEHKQALDQIALRMVDLLIPFRSRFLYHPDMLGSASIKSVLAAFYPDMNYADLEISDGATASFKYLQIVKGVAKARERAHIFDALKRYCQQDTLAEVRLLSILYGYASST